MPAACGGSGKRCASARGHDVNGRTAVQVNCLGRPDARGVELCRARDQAGLLEGLAQDVVIVGEVLHQLEHVALKLHRPFEISLLLDGPLDTKRLGGCAVPLNQALNGEAGLSEERVLGVDTDVNCATHLVDPLAYLGGIVAVNVIWCRCLDAVLKPLAADTVGHIVAVQPGQVGAQVGLVYLQVGHAVVIASQLGERVGVFAQVEPHIPILPCGPTCQGFVDRSLSLGQSQGVARSGLAVLGVAYADRPPVSVPCHRCGAGDKAKRPFGPLKPFRNSDCVRFALDRDRRSAIEQGVVDDVRSGALYIQVHCLDHEDPTALIAPLHVAGEDGRFTVRAKHEPTHNSRCVAWIRVRPGFCNR